MENCIPIIDIKSKPNPINGFNRNKENYWELFFDQPFNYNLEEVLKNGINIININRPWKQCYKWPDQRSMPFGEVERFFWHNFANKYLHIKKELIDLSDKIIHKLFKHSKNILGVLARGTDYIAMKPKKHPIQPKLSDIISDVKKMDEKYAYDYIFFSSDDEKYRDEFSKNFKNKIKQIRPKIKINYDYSRKTYLGFNNNIKGNIEFNKIYLLNIIILSKCLDIVTPRCNGAVGIFVLTKGFRNMKIYNLGLY